MSEENKEVVVGDGIPADEVKKPVGHQPPPAPSNEPPKGEEIVKDGEKVADVDEGSEKTEEELEEAKRPAEQDESSGALDTDVWGDTGSEVGNSTLTLIQNAGVSTEDAKALLYDAVVAGDATKVDVAKLEELVGKDKATLVIAGVKGFITETNEKNSSIRSAVFDAAGGEDTWNKVVDWAKSSDTDLSEYAPLIDAGGAQARFAVAEIKAKYNADANNTALPKEGQAPRQEGTSSTAPTIKPLGTAEYVIALEKAYNKGDKQEMDRITAARRLGRSQGLK